MPTRREWERREKQRRAADDGTVPVEESAADTDEAGNRDAAQADSEAASGSAHGGADGGADADDATTDLASPPPPLDPMPETNPAHSLAPKDAYTGRPDQGITGNTGPGAGGATEWGGGNKNHPSRISGKPPGG